MWCGLLKAVFPSCYLINSVKPTKSTDPNQAKSPTNLIFLDPQTSEARSRPATMSKKHCRNNIVEATGNFGNRVDWWAVSWSRCVPPCLGDAIWWMLTKYIQNGLFHSWINVWVADKTVWTPCHSATCRAAGDC